MGTDETDAPANGRDVGQGQLAIVKPRVLLLLVFSGLTGFLLATTQADATSQMFIWLLVGGVLATASANIYNNILDREQDSLMVRTMWRPLPTGAVTPGQAAAFGAVLGLAGLAILYVQLNPITAALTLAGMLFYIIVYTMVLKPLTVENITIGGVAGAFPPLVGWTAVTGQIDWPPLYLGLLVILWTPPHFWSLALFHQEDYQRAGVPMLPVVKGERETQRRIATYTIVLIAASIMLFIFWNEMGVVYLVGVIALNVPMFFLVGRLLDRGDMSTARALFVYSNVYLLMLFVLIILDAVLFEFIP
ncbi:MAG: heme o synthase [Thermoplasmata archaeon]|nr:heme o synthase [Thermoplasmata archaeon]